MVAANTIGNGMPYFKICEGTYRIRVKVRLPIKAGLYQLDVSLNSISKGQLERCHLEPKLNVLPYKTSLPEKWHGLITEPVDFKMEPSGK